jgi:opacity protein-like surface antigen
MKSLARNSKLALLGLSGLLALPVSAENIGIYAGLQAGYSNTDTNEDVIELDSSETYEIYGGYKFLDWLGIELGYAQLGQFDVDTIGGDRASGDSGIPVEMQSLYTGISLWGPFIGPVGAFAKLGGHYSEAKLNKNDSLGNDYDETTANLYYSVGLQVPIVEFLSITLAYQNFRKIDILKDSGDRDLGDAGVDTYSLGVQFNF